MRNPQKTRKNNKNIPVGRIVFWKRVWYNVARHYIQPNGIQSGAAYPKDMNTDKNERKSAVISRENGSVAKENEKMSEHTHTHTHVAPDGTIYEHTHENHSHMDEHGHDHGHTHTHTHTHQNTKAVLNRLSRAIGHMESIKRMVEDGRDCSEVLVQLSAVKAAINNTAKVILKDHIEHCMVDAVESGDHEAIEELTAAIDRFIK